MSEVLVVHCVDTEGPLGGDARRRPDGSPEFFDNWADILASLGELTADEFRRSQADSKGGPYRFSWFLLDFTGFRTNPKKKVTAYHDTYDRLRSLPTELDGFYWHYHAPPARGSAALTLRASPGSPPAPQRSETRPRRGPSRPA